MEDEQMTSPLQNPMISLGLAVTGAVLGLLGMIIAMTAKSNSAELDKRVKSMEASVAEMASAAGMAADVNKRLNALDQASDSLALKVGEMDTNIRSLAEQTSSAINNINADIANTRKMVGSGSRTASAARKGGPRRSGGTAAASAEPMPKEGQYKIQKGDTLAAVARRYGIKLGALQDANPDLDPRRLKIGQIINLPK